MVVFVFSFYLVICGAIFTQLQSFLLQDLFLLV